MQTEILLIGIRDATAISSKETLEQIQKVKSYECSLNYCGEDLTWDDFDNPNEPRTLFQTILRDRKKRVDQNMLMANRPPFAVVTVRNDKAVRLEFYEGHDALSLSYDIRDKELQGKHLPKFLDEDVYAYDPAKFLKDSLGISESISRPILEQLHKED